MAEGPSRAPRPDAELIAEVIAGDRAAFDELVERYQRRAFSVSTRLLGDAHDALEVCQEAFVRAFSKLDTLEARERFGPWLMRIVANLSLNRRRDRAAAARVGRADANVGELEANGARARAPHAALDDKELLEELSRAIDRLPTMQRMALTLFAIERMPQKDVAEIMGCSVEAVKWHVFQARKRLRERLADYL
ncbi:MAG: sigma-70 family RNA polymerase sigma factor [Phycisphaerales bacterium]|nr:sigma-70 family RNA polymerase sigma factor [Phycisphaerales bacterium]